MAFVNKVNGIPIDEFLAVNPNYIKAPALDKYGNPYLFEDGTPQYTVIPKSDEEIPTIDPFSGQPVSEQDQAAFTQTQQDIFPQDIKELKEKVERYIDYLKSLNPNNQVPGSAGAIGLPGEVIAREQEALNNILSQYTGKKTTEVPTVDPFSGQQVSAQDQAAFTQPQQDIFPTNLDGITSLIDSMGAKPNQFTTEEGYKKIGEDNSARRQSMMDSLSSAYSGIATLATIPATFFQSLVGLDLPGSGFRTEAMEQNLADIISQKGVPQGTIGYEDFGLNFGQEGSVLKNIINNKAGLANALTLGRVGYNVDPSTGKINFSNTEYDFSPGEISFANKFSRPVLEFLSKGGAFGDKPITLNPNVKLSSNDPILNSLTENFNNLSLQQMNQIRNTPREALIEQARSGGQKGGIGYLLGF